MKNKSKVLVKNFQGFVLGWCQNAHILFQGRAPRAFCIMPFGVGHLGNADFSVLSHDSACTMKLVIENYLWLSVID